MPYVPSEKTDGKSQDRNLIDAKVKVLASFVSKSINTNKDFKNSYIKILKELGEILIALEKHTKEQGSHFYTFDLARTIHEVGSKYEYEGAFLGELNYAVTRLIQEVPKRVS